MHKRIRRYELVASALGSGGTTIDGCTIGQLWEACLGKARSGLAWCFAIDWATEPGLMSSSVCSPQIDATNVPPEAPSMSPQRTKLLVDCILNVLLSIRSCDTRGLQKPSNKDSSFQNID